MARFPLAGIGRGVGLAGATGATGSVGSLTTSVKDAPYSAVGDGTADDTAAVQAAINAVAAVGGELFFPRGTYKITSTLTVPYPLNSGFRMRGAGPVMQYQGGVSKLLYTASTGHLLTLYSISDWELTDLEFDYNNAAFTGDLIDVDGQPHAADVQNFHITRCGSRYTPGFVGPARSIVRFNQVVIGTVELCHWTGATNSLRLGDNGGSYVNVVQIEKCCFNFASTGHIYIGTGDGESITIRDCTFEAGINTPGIIGDTGTRLYKPLIDGCWFGDASGTNVWIDGLACQSNLHVGTISNCAFFLAGSVNSVAIKFGAKDSSNNAGNWLVTGCTVLGSGNAFDTYTPPGYLKVFALGNTYVSTTNTWKSGTPAPLSYYSLGCAGENDTMDRLGLRGNVNVEQAGITETLTIAGGTGAATNAFAALPGTTTSAIYAGFGGAFVPRVSIQAANVTDSEVVLGAGTAPTKTVWVKDNAKLGFYATTPVVQAARAGQLTDSTGGTVTATLAAGITDTVAKNAIASLAAKVNALETIIHNLGLSA